jgi:hypothetical protein
MGIVFPHEEDFLKRNVIYSQLHHIKHHESQDTTCKLELRDVKLTWTTS